MRPPEGVCEHRGVPDPDALIRGNTTALRAARPDDRQRWFEAQTDPVQLRFGLPAFVDPPTAPDALDERIAESREHLRDGVPGVLVVVGTGAADRLLATISWRYDVHEGLRIADVGYSVHPDARRRGVATAALALMVRWLLHDEAGPGLARVQLDHSVENLASCRTALAAGMVQEGLRRSYLPLRDPDAPDGVRRHDVCLHGVVAPAAQG